MSQRLMRWCPCRAHTSHPMSEPYRPKPCVRALRHSPMSESYRSEPCRSEPYIRALMPISGLHATKQIPPSTLLLSDHVACHKQGTSLSFFCQFFCLAEPVVGRLGPEMPCCRGLWHRSWAVSSCHPDPSCHPPCHPGPSCHPSYHPGPAPRSRVVGFAGPPTSSLHWHRRRRALRPPRRG